jgi:hypothetical protein
MKAAAAEDLPPVILSGLQAIRTKVRTKPFESGLKTAPSMEARKLSAR